MKGNGERTVNKKVSWGYGMCEKITREMVDVGRTTDDRPTTFYSLIAFNK